MWQVPQASGRRASIAELRSYRSADLLVDPEQREEELKLLQAEGFVREYELRIRKPDGEERTFDLSDPEQPRDLSLTPELIDWIEEHFQLVKLRADYPHWDDAVVLPGEEE